MQITKAMELVASSKLRKAKEKAEKAQPFFNALYETMCEIAQSNKDFSSPFTAKRKINTVTIIVIAGDRGLARPAGAAKEIGMAEALAHDGVAQDPHDRILADQLGEGLGAVFAVEGLGHGLSSLARLPCPEYR